MTRIIWKRVRAKQAGIVWWKSHADLGDKTGSRHGTFIFLWLVGAIMIFALLYSASHIALLSLPKHEGMNMRSKLAAEYSVWKALEFQPVDLAIIEELQLERDLPGQLIIDDPGGPTSAPLVPSSSLTQAAESPTPQATLEQPTINPTEIQPSLTLTPVPTDTVLQPSSTETPQVSQPRPTKTRRPKKTPKPPKPEKAP